MNLVEKAAYLKGLAEGLGMDPQSKEGRLWAALNELLSDMAHELEVFFSGTSFDDGGSVLIEGICEAGFIVTGSAGAGIIFRAGPDGIEGSLHFPVSVHDTAAGTDIQRDSGSFRQGKDEFLFIRFTARGRGFSPFKDADIAAFFIIIQPTFGTGSTNTYIFHRPENVGTG